MPTHNSTKTKINFGRKMETVRTSGKPKTDVNQSMRLVIDEMGKIIFANNSFSKILVIEEKEIIGRQLLDTVFFDDLHALSNDRAIFNNISQGTSIRLQNLESGNYLILIGSTQENFQFDWITISNKRYLVASTQGDHNHGYDDEINWQNIIDQVKKEAITVSDQAQEIIHPTSLESSQIPLDIIIDDNANIDEPVPKKTKANDLRTFSKMHRDLLCIFDQNGFILRTNDRFIETTTLRHKKPSKFIDLIHNEDQDLVIQAIKQISSTHESNKTITIETRIFSEDSTTAWIKWYLENQDGEIYALGYDITAHKTSEQELSEAQALANMGHWRWRFGNTTIEWSEQIFKIFDMDSQSFKPTLDNVRQFFHKRDFGRMMQAFQRAIIEQNNYDMDFRIIRQDGSTRYIRCEGRCELDSDGDAIALYGIMQDVTDQTMHEMDLREAKEAAEQAYAAKSRFLANMSHELRTPLNAIIGFSDMIERQMLGPLGSEKYVDYAGSIKDSGEHLLDLITDILDMSKIEAGKYTLDLEKIQLGNVIHTATRMIESRAQEGLLVLENNAKCDDPIIIADRRAIMQILLNILSNAVKFTEPGGKLTINCETFDTYVTVTITDTGIGIPANKLNAVMRPFEQVSTAFTRNHEGSGLGLAITKELAELHGGMLGLESTVGQGTIATLRLPIDGSKVNRTKKTNH
jgi:two-component system cell cycle sensor histidine kinase PleC